MTDKLTDKEVIKALGRISCKTLNDCKSINNAIDLINSLQEEKEDLISGQEILQKYIAEQKLENEKLQKFKAYFDFYYGSDIEILGIDENGDTTSFDEFYNCAIANAESIEHHIVHIIKIAKAEAVKEFWDELKKHTYTRTGQFVMVEDGDNLLKEWLGGDNQ